MLSSTSSITCVIICFLKIKIWWSQVKLFTLYFTRNSISNFYFLCWLTSISEIQKRKLPKIKHSRSLSRAFYYCKLTSVNCLERCNGWTERELPEWKVSMIPVLRNWWYPIKEETLFHLVFFVEFALFWTVRLLWFTTIRLSC